MPIALGWNITFIGVQYNFPNPGQSTWTYSVQATGPGPTVKGLSHLVFGICANLFSAFVSGSITPDPGTPWSVFIEPNDPSGCNGVKFNDLGIAANPSQTWIFSFVLNANPPAGDICLTVKAGQPTEVVTITGPICAVTCEFFADLCVTFDVEFTVDCDATVVDVLCQPGCPTVGA